MDQGLSHQPNAVRECKWSELRASTRATWRPTGFSVGPCAIFTFYKRPQWLSALRRNIPLRRRHDDLLRCSISRRDNYKANCCIRRDHNLVRWKSPNTTPREMQSHATTPATIHWPSARADDREQQYWLASSERLLGLQVDHKLTWSKHAAAVTKAYASKLSLLRRMRFLPTTQLEDFYFKVIMPSVTYGLSLWGSCNKTHINNLEKLHIRAARIIHRLPWDANSEEVLALTKWDTIATMYKRRLAELVYKVVKNLVPDELTNLFRRKTSTYRLRREKSLALLRPETNVLRDSIAYRGALLWNTLPRAHNNGRGHSNIQAHPKETWLQILYVWQISYAFNEQRWNL